MVPIAASIDPNKQKTGFPIYISVLNQTPATRKIPPIKKPIFIPYLSRIKFTGNENMGWNIPNTKVLSVTISFVY